MGLGASVANLDRKKADIDRLGTRYLKLYERCQHMRDAEEMAALAEQLGPHLKPAFLDHSLPGRNPSDKICGVSPVALLKVS